MIVEVKVPEVGESITEGLLSAWEKNNGDQVQAEDPLFELETDKVTVTVSAELAGQLKILAPTGDTVEIGRVVATIDTEAQAEAPATKAEVPENSGSPAAATDTQHGSTQEEASSKPVEKTPLKAVAPQENQATQLFVPPSVRRRIREQGTVGEGAPSRNAVTTAGSTGPAASPAIEPASPAIGGSSPRQTREKMSPMRRRIAERLVESQKTAAMLTTFNEVDMTNAMEWRRRHKERFKEIHGVGLGFMSFFVKAVVSALQLVPEVNRQIEGDELVTNHFYDIGIAVSSEKGLVVPVVRNADQLDFAGIEREISRLAGKVRDRKIELSDLSGGVFTISNGGVFGSLLSTPILNPPQAGVMGMHGIKKRPIAIGDDVVIRPMMFLAMSYDHRIVDGREAVTFLKRVVECVEEPERTVLEI